MSFRSLSVAFGSERGLLEAKVSFDFSDDFVGKVAGVVLEMVAWQYLSYIHDYLTSRSDGQPSGGDAVPPIKAGGGGPPQKDVATTSRKIRAPAPAPGPPPLKRRREK
eukprot:CAMPEP_0119156558 /NCGR_PEP_ID=MMETSP1310-20130426/52316_1 /TAXON_ID=464262 /ORGANISM="Genus nov. species nov., Strain RCC2339" /LENGTH=107 /DNA_ID=CAMNT_0007149173 /DNA_START=6 /DNA_END=329 /DNA_ORIENTATION=-